MKALERSSVSNSRPWLLPRISVGEFLRRDGVIAEDGLGEEAKELGKLLLPDVEMRHFLREMIEQRRMMGERQDDGDGKAVG